MLITKNNYFLFTPVYAHNITKIDVLAHLEFVHAVDSQIDGVLVVRCDHEVGTPVLHPVQHVRNTSIYSVTRKRFGRRRISTESLEKKKKESSIFCIHRAFSFIFLISFPLGT